MMPLSGQRDWERMEQAILPHPVHPVNPHDFPYIINNPGICPKNQRLSYVVYIHSGPESFDLRQSIRDTWGQPDLINNHPSRLVFFLGRPRDDDATLAKIHDESGRFQDLVVVDYMEDYRNMTYKAISAFKWFSVYCPNTTYLIKADDDAYIDMAFMLQTLDTEYKTQERFFLCWLYPNNSMAILRDESSCDKWCAPPSFMPGSTRYPAYCSGSAYVLTQDLALDLYNASLHTPFFFIDDVYATGLLRFKIPRKVNMFSFQLRRYEFSNGELEKAMQSGALFPEKLVVHELYHRAWMIRDLFAANLRQMDSVRRSYLSTSKLESIAKSLSLYNTTLPSMYANGTLHQPSSLVV